MTELERARERIAKAAERDGEMIFAREVRAGAWDHRNDVQAALRGSLLKGERCEWFALCDNPATKTEPHPILFHVPICDRCVGRRLRGRHE